MAIQSLILATGRPNEFRLNYAALGLADNLDEINPHAALLMSESHVSDGERAWLRWARHVEKALGHGLDGNRFTDGFSIDFALAAFEAGVSVAEYVEEVRADVAELDAAFGPLLLYPQPGRRL